MRTQLQVEYDRFKKRISRVQLTKILVDTPRQFNHFQDIERWNSQPYLYPSQTAALVKFACLYAKSGAQTKNLNYHDYDTGRLANPYKDFWQHAENLSSYSEILTWSAPFFRALLTNEGG